MAKTRAMTRSQNNDDRKRFKNTDNGGASDLNHDMLFLVMMQLRFVDFLAFSAVCKSWRSLALLNRKKFIASRPPMLIKYLPDKNECYLQDFEGGNFKTLIPHSTRRECVGLTCGYLISFRGATHDFWLVNPIIRHKLYFPCVPKFDVGLMKERLRAVLVFSPSISRWVFVVTFRLTNKIWFSIDGKGAWNHVSSTLDILDLHVFKGKIYALNYDQQVCEMSLNPEPKLTLIEINKRLEPSFYYPKFVSAGENLYVIDGARRHLYREIRELDHGKKKWVLPEEKTIGEYVLFLSTLLNGVAVNGAAVKLESQAADLQSQYKMYDCFPGTTQNSEKGRFFATSNMWYFLHECMNAHFIDE